MRLHRGTVFSVVMLLFGFANDEVVTAQECPASCFADQLGPTRCSFAASDSSTFHVSCPNPEPVETAFASYDATTGRTHARVDIPGNCTQGQGRAEVLVADRFRILGPGSGPIEITAVLETTGFGDLEGFSLREGSGTPSWSVYSEMNRSISLPLVHQIGEEFVLQYGIYAAAFHGFAYSGIAVLDGTLSFEGLEAGYSVTSCQGYVDGTVATEQLDWGQVKVLYKN